MWPHRRAILKFHFDKTPLVGGDRKSLLDRTIHQRGSPLVRSEPSHRGGTLQETKAHHASMGHRRRRRRLLLLIPTGKRGSRKRSRNKHQSETRQKKSSKKNRER